MAKYEKPVDDVVRFNAECSGIIGNLEYENFSLTMLFFCERTGIESPIEQILYMAVMTLLRVNYFVEGFGMQAQYAIEPYRVDFLASYLPEDKTEKRELVVECDSQTFHERTEEERRYEKRRDRFLNGKGFTVYHFTGTEIKKEPFRVAAEIIAHLTGRSKDDILDGLTNYRD